MSEYKISFDTSQSEASLKSLFDRLIQIGNKADEVDGKHIRINAKASEQEVANLKQELNTLFSNNLSQASVTFSKHLERVEAVTEATSKDIHTLTESLEKNRAQYMKNKGATDKQVESNEKVVASSKEIQRQLREEAILAERLKAAKAGAALGAARQEPDVLRARIKAAGELKRELKSIESDIFSDVDADKRIKDLERQAKELLDVNSKTRELHEANQQLKRSQKTLSDDERVKDLERQAKELLDVNSKTRELHEANQQLKRSQKTLSDDERVKDLERQAKELLDVNSKTRELHEANQQLKRSQKTLSDDERVKDLERQAKELLDVNSKTRELHEANQQLKRSQKTLSDDERVKDLERQAKELLDVNSKTRELHEANQQLKRSQKTLSDDERVKDLERQAKELLDVNSKTRELHEANQQLKRSQKTLSDDERVKDLERQAKELLDVNSKTRELHEANQQLKRSQKTLSDDERVKDLERQAKELLDVNSKTRELHEANQQLKRSQKTLSDDERVKDLERQAKELLDVNSKTRELHEANQQLKRSQKTLSDDERVKDLERQAKELLDVNSKTRELHEANQQLKRSQKTLSDDERVKDLERQAKELLDVNSKTRELHEANQQLKRSQKTLSDDERVKDLERQAKELLDVNSKTRELHEANQQLKRSQKTLSDDERVKDLERQAKELLDVNSKTRELHEANQQLKRSQKTLSDDERVKDLERQAKELLDVNSKTRELHEANQQLKRSQKTLSDDERVKDLERQAKELLDVNSKTRELHEANQQLKRSQKTLSDDERVKDLERQAKELLDVNSKTRELHEANQQLKRSQKTLSDDERVKDLERQAKELLDVNSKTRELHEANQQLKRSQKTLSDDERVKDLERQAKELLDVNSKTRELHEANQQLKRSQKTLSDDERVKDLERQAKELLDVNSKTRELHEANQQLKRSQKTLSDDERVKDLERQAKELLDVNSKTRELHEANQQLKRSQKTLSDDERLKRLKQEEAELKNVRSATRQLFEQEQKLKGIRKELSKKDRLKTLQAEYKALQDVNSATAQAVMLESQISKRKAELRGETKNLTKSIHTSAQATAVWRAGLNAAGTSMGIFTSQTIAAASATYAAVSAFRASITAGVEFTDTMARVQAVTGSTAETLEWMSQEVRSFAGETIFTAKEAADALLQLGMAGLSAEEAVTAMPATLRLASIGLMQAGEAADLATNVMTQFGLGAEHLTAVVDDLATVANNSNTTISQLGLALTYAGPAAASANVHITEVTAAIGALASAGIKGSRSGTAMRRMLQMLVAPTDKAKAALTRLGVSTRDIHGNARPLVDVIEDLSKANMTNADAIDLVTLRQSQGLIAIVNSIDKFKELEKQQQDNAHAAKEFQSTIEDTLGADFKLLVSAAYEKMLEFFDLNKDGFRELVQGATQLVKELNVELINKTLHGILDVVQEFALVAGTLWGAAKIAQISTFVKSLGDVKNEVGDVVGKVSIFRGVLKALWGVVSRHPLVAAASAVAYLGSQFLFATESAETYRDRLEDLHPSLLKTKDMLDKEREAQKKNNEERKESIRLTSAESHILLAEQLDKRRALQEELSREQKKLSSLNTGHRAGLPAKKVEELKKEIAETSEDITVLNREIFELNKYTDINGRTIDKSTHLYNEFTNSIHAAIGAMAELSASERIKGVDKELEKSNRQLELQTIFMTDAADKEKTLYEGRLANIRAHREAITSVYSGENGEITKLVDEIYELEAQRSKLAKEDKEFMGKDILAKKYEHLYELSQDLSTQLQRSFDMEQKLNDDRLRSLTNVEKSVEGIAAAWAKAQTMNLSEEQLKAYRKYLDSIAAGLKEIKPTSEWDDLKKDLMTQIKLMGMSAGEAALYQVEMRALSAAEAQYGNELKAGRISRETYNKKVEEARLKSRELKEELIELRKEQERAKETADDYVKSFEEGGVSAEELAFAEKDLEENVAKGNLTRKEAIRILNLLRQAHDETAQSVQEASKEEAEAILDQVYPIREVQRQWKRAQELHKQGFFGDKGDEVLEEYRKILFEAEGATKEFEDYLVDFMDDMDGVFQDAWRNIDDGFEGLVDGILDSFRDMLAEMAHDAITKPIIMDIKAGITGSNGGVVNTLSSLGSSTSIYDGISGIFGAGSTAPVAAAGVGTGSLAGTYGIQAATGVGTGNLAGTYGIQAANTGGASAIAGASNAAMLGAGILGGIGGDLLFDGKGESSTGGSLGATAGMYLGGPVGAVIGTVLGSALGSMFGDKGPSFEFATRNQGDNFQFENENENVLSQSAFGELGFADKGTRQLQSTFGSFDNAKTFLDGLAAIDDAIAGLAQSTDELQAMKATVDDVSVSGDSPSEVIEGLSNRYLLALSETSSRLTDGISKVTEEYQKWDSSVSTVDGNGAFVTAEKVVANVENALLEEFLKLDTDKAIPAIASVVNMERIGEEIGGTVVADLYDALSTAVADGSNLSEVTMVLEQALNNIPNLERLNESFDRTAEGALTASFEMTKLAGGITNLQTMQNKYYDLFFTEEEKAANKRQELQKQINATFEEYNAEVPDSIQAFKDLKNSLDLTTDSGREANLSLLQIAPAFAEYQKSIAEYQTSMEELNGMFTDIVNELDIASSSFASTEIIFRKANTAMKALGLSSRSYMEAIDDLEDYDAEQLKSLAERMGLSFAEVSEHIRDIISANDEAVDQGKEGVSSEALDEALTYSQAEEAVSNYRSALENSFGSLLEETFGGEIPTVTAAADALEVEAPDMSGLEDLAENWSGLIEKVFNGKLPKSVDAAVDAWDAIPDADAAIPESSLRDFVVGIYDNIIGTNASDVVKSGVISDYVDALSDGSRTIESVLSEITSNVGDYMGDAEGIITSAYAALDLHVPGDRMDWWIAKVEEGTTTLDNFAGQFVDKIQEIQGGFSDQVFQSIPDRIEDVGGSGVLSSGINSFISYLQKSDDEINDLVENFKDTDAFSGVISDGFDKQSVSFGKFLNDLDAALKDASVDGDYAGFFDLLSDFQSAKETLDGMPEPTGEAAEAVKDLTDDIDKFASAISKEQQQIRELHNLRGEGQALRDLEIEQLKEIEGWKKYELVSRQKEIWALEDFLSVVGKASDFIEGDMTSDRALGVFSGLGSEAESVIQSLSEMTESEFADFLADSSYSVDDMSEAVKLLTEDIEEFSKTAEEVADDAFSDLEKAVQAERDRLSTLVDNTEDAYALLERSVDAEMELVDKRRDALNLQLETTQGAINDLQSLFDVLDQGVDDMSSRSSRQRFMSSSEDLAEILRQARSGELPTSDEMSDVLSGLTGADESSFNSAQEMELERARAANRVDVLKDLTGDQLTTEEETLQVLEAQEDLLDDQAARLEQQLQTAKMQLDAALDIDQSVVGVGEAVSLFNEELLLLEESNYASQMEYLDQVLIDGQEQVNAIKGVDDSVKSVRAAISALGSLASSAGSSGGSGSGSGSDGGSSALDMGDRLSEAGYSADVVSTFRNSSDEAQRSIYNSLVDKGKVPAFADGGMHSGGLRLVGERGPELEVTGPARYYDTQKTMQMMGNNQQLINAISELRGIMLKDTDNTDRMQRIMQRWDIQGQPDVRDVTV